ncbi:hypothetical protein NPIL_592741 [Nephila pilipes]|uniref:Reverse transcriptase n=1 Tax=Nephila pilipes TaxID=299642 RepID=A0A8X6JF48_NEPPI|nr:hypothetical protein NPIL_592741 [Nephila pilipes]
MFNKSYRLIVELKGNYFQGFNSFNCYKRLKRDFKTQEKSFRWEIRNLASSQPLGHDIFYRNLIISELREAIRGLKCIRRSGVPSVWEKVIIVPIHKKNKPPDNLNSYNPISFTNVLSKIRLDSIVKKRDFCPIALRAIALETIHTRFPPNERLHAGTNGSLLKFSQGAGTRDFRDFLEDIDVDLLRLAVHFDIFKGAIISKILYLPFRLCTETGKDSVYRDEGFC